MPPLYLMQQGAKIRIQNQCIVVEAHEGGEILTRVPVGHISEVVLFGNINLTTPAIQTLLNQNIPVTFLSTRGHCFGRLVGVHSPHVPLRKAQYRCCDMPDFCLAMAKGIVTAKVRHQRVILQRIYQRAARADLNSPADKMKDVEKLIQAREKITSLRGVEGKAAAMYFQAFREMLDPGWAFNRRQYHPSPDPINAMLSFGYTLLTEAAVSAVRTVGMDPYAGFLHETVYNRPSLALDLVEEFRPVIDGMILWLVKTEQVTPQDFKMEEGAAQQTQCRMNEGARRNFLRAYEDRMQKKHTHPASGNALTLRACLLEQARQIRTRVETEQPGYDSLGFR